MKVTECLLGTIIDNKGRGHARFHHVLDRRDNQRFSGHPAELEAVPLLASDALADRSVGAPVVWLFWRNDHGCVEAFMETPHWHLEDR